MNRQQTPTRAELAMYFWSLPSDDALVDRETAGAAAGLGKKAMDLLAMEGGGPAYKIIRRRAMYERGDVIAWISKTGRKVTTSAERAPKAIAEVAS